MEFLRTPDPGASVALWATPGGTANVSSVTPAAAGADHSGDPSLDRAGIKSSFQTLFSPKTGTTPAVLSRGQTVPSLTPFIGGTTPNLVTPALGILPTGPSPRADIPLPNVSNRGLPTPDMMRSPFLQAAAKEAVRREFLSMPSYITATDVSAASEQTVPENEFSSGPGQGQQKLVFAKDGAPVPPNALSAFPRQDANIPLPQTSSGSNHVGMSGNSVTRNLGDKNAVGVSGTSMYAESMGFDASKSSGPPGAGKLPNDKSPESNQRVPRVNTSLHDADSQSHGRDASNGSTLPSNSQAQSASQPDQPPQHTSSQRIQQYPQQPVAPFPVNQAQLQSQQRQQPYAAFPSTGQPSFNPMQGPPGMFLMGQPPMVMATHPPHGTQLFAHPSGALMMFATPGTAPHAVMQPHPGIMMHSGHQQHLVHPSAASVKPETAEERRERVEREKQELIREFKKKTREAALVRFRQKRRERRFGKLIRYDCRKKLADARPRVKGRFVRIRGDDLDEEEDESEQAQVVPSLDE